MFIWIALKENARLARILWIISKVYSNQDFGWCYAKNTRNKEPQRNLILKLQRVKLVATKEESGTVHLSKPETWSFHEEAVTGRPIDYKIATGKPVASNKSENSGNPKAERKEWPHNLHMSPATVPHTNAVFSMRTSTRTWT